MSGDGEPDTFGDALDAALALAQHLDDLDAVRARQRPGQLGEAGADIFEDYLRHDGIEDVLKARQAEKGGRTLVRERYSKHDEDHRAGGSTLTDEHATPFGLPAEILLL